MKNLFIFVFAVALLAACGKKAEEQKPQEMTVEQEQAVADSVVSELGAAQEQLQTETQQSAEEIDSLLENF